VKRVFSGIEHFENAPPPYSSVSEHRHRVRAHVFVSGTVQGVYYRATTRETARTEGVDGWVRNLDDGRVEAVFEGSEAAVESMIEFCHEGSNAAVVEEVDVEYESPEGIDGFEIRR
jgi:acylphosphatase